MSDIAPRLDALLQFGAIGTLADDELLRRSLQPGEGESGSAFRVLVERHGPVVLGVCRRMLADHHVAEDAFQTTFLVLLRRAEVAARQDRLANWLLSVAVRASKEIRRSEARRRSRERAAVGVRPAVLVADPTPGLVDLSSVLNEELGHLPRHYRAALIACE